MILLGFETTDHLHESENSNIYRARPLAEMGTVILKILKGDHPSPLRLARFRRAFETAALFQSPRILKVFSLKTVGKSLALIVEDFAADSLDHWFRNHKISCREGLAIAIAICEGLADIHGLGIVHKDIAPSNILWNKAANRVTITDFGASSPMDRALTMPYAPSVLEGTIAFMSPEQTGRMNRPVDYRSDFYSLGVTLYELFTGEKPFATADPLELIHCHVAKRPVAPHKLNTETPEAISNIILKLMEKNAEDRYQSAEGIMADLVECLRQLDLHGTIGLFPQARHDVSSRFQLSPRLYGREKDVAVLCKEFDRVLAGEMAFTLVSGYSGVGKSSLVQELYRPLAVARGRYVTGKYDQYQRSVPYSAITQALNFFCDQLLGESAEVLQSWRERILNAVGRNGSAVIEVIPRLEKVIGPQPSLPEREPQTGQNLMQQLWQSFFLAICNPEEPLVLFLDDLQWADRASLSLLKTILSNPRQRGLHLVGAYRDNEVDSTHPLVLMLEELAAQADRSFLTIHLDPLSFASVAALIADTLSSPAVDTAELAEIIYLKTHGNAFFALEFFKALHADGLLQFDFALRKWVWNMEAIHARQITDNVVTLMATRIALLPTPTQQLLMLAACIGNHFQLTTLAVIAQDHQTPFQILECITPALRLGIVAARDDAQEQSSNGAIDVAHNTFRFQHDRVQQAAYSLIPEDERPGMHLGIARKLLDGTRLTGDLDGSLFEIVSHLKKGIAGIVDRDERLQTARLNFQAGLKAKKASAYHASWDHFRVARDMLPTDCFDSDYELAFQIHLGLAKSSSVAGKHDESEALYSFLLEKAKTTLDKSQVHLVQMDDYHLQGAYERAITIQKKSLMLLGETVPDDDRAFNAAIDNELSLTDQYRGTRALADLIAANEIESPEIIAALRTLMSMWISAHLASHQPMVQWCSMKLANLSLKHGNSEMAAFAFVQLGYISIVRLQRFEEGYAYGQLALQMADRCTNLEMRGKIYFMFGLYICHWKEHVSLSTASLRKAYAFSVESGDWTYAVYSACNIISNSICCGVPCSDVYREALTFLEFLKDKAVVGMKSFFVPGPFCALLNLQGKTNTKDTLSCEYFDENVFVKTLGTVPIVEAYYLAHKIRSMFLNRSFDAASDAIAKIEGLAITLPGQFRVADAYFFGCLMLAATACQDTDAGLRTRAWSLFDRYETQLKLWAHECPANYLHRYYLIRGERARLEQGELAEVLQWFDRAIQSAKNFNFANMVALANELKGRFWQEKRLREYALIHLREAHGAYHAWGATGKVAMLEQEFPELAFQAGEGRAITAAHLDLLSVHKAARALSAKVEVRELIHEMMSIVMESAGADRGVLLLDKEGKWEIEACADLGSKGVEIGWTGATHGGTNKMQKWGVPSSVVSYVARTQAPVTVSEPRLDARFGQDVYITEVSPRSILCVPVVNQGQMTGIIYLENKLAADVFSSERQDFIDVLAGQLAISLENVTLYAHLKETVAKQNEMMSELQSRNEEINVVSLQRKAAEEETRLLNVELELRVQERTADLRRSNEELEQFAYVASHDLQEPLRKVSSFAQLLASRYKGKLDGDADDYIGFMVDGALRMQVLIQNMLAYSRLGSKGRPFAQADGNAILKQAIANLQTAIEDSGAVVASTPLPTVLADQVQLVQLFQNLIGNAIKFCKAEIPQVDIHAEARGATWTFSVRDNGIGIAPQFAERVFVIFQRLHSRDEYSGTGIGLAFCKKIVERHGGRIWMESEIGRGTTFFFTLSRVCGDGESLREVAKEA